MSDIFEKAARKRLRFSSGKGSVNTEDLYTLPMETLDKIAIDLDAELSTSGRKSFIKDTTRESSVVRLKFDVVKRVIDYRLEQKAKKEEREKLVSERQKILEIIQRKQNQSLEASSMEELTALLEKSSVSTEEED